MRGCGPSAGSPEYAHARIRARWGSRPDDTAWHRIEITRELAPLLELARAGSLVRWVQGLAADSGLHATEHVLRLRWREAVDEVAGWMEGDWQPAFRWCGHLADLPAVQQWARGEPMAAWISDDEVLAPRLKRGHDDPVDAPGTAPGWRALVEEAHRQPEKVAVLWLQAWRRLLPAGPARGVIERELVRPLAAHAEAFASPSTVDGWSERRALAARLVGLLRRHPAEPLEAFVYLALMGLELERLRAEIVARAAFPKRTLHE